MKEIVSSNHPIRIYFASAVHKALAKELGLQEQEVEDYLTGMLLAFLHYDALFGVRNREGRPVTAVAEMLLEGDVRFNADSFEREREVHRHIGDLLLFSSGLFPEFLQMLRSPFGKDALLDPVGQGKHSYHVASTFDYDPYCDEAKILRKLSDDFETYRYGLGLVRASFEGFRLQGWPDGFTA